VLHVKLRDCFALTVTSLLRIEINLNVETLLQNVAVIDVFLDIFFHTQFPEPSYHRPRCKGPQCTKLGRITLFIPWTITVHTLHSTLFIPWTTLFIPQAHKSQPLPRTTCGQICHGILSQEHGEGEEYIEGAHRQRIWAEQRCMEVSGDQW
jgi:hypothetical protein